MSALDRRTFLSTAAVAGVLGAQATAAQPAAQPNGAANRLVVGVMGTGGRGTSLATSFQRQENVDVRFVCDVDAGKAQRAAQAVQKAGGREPRVVEDFRRILEDRNVDVLVVATCNHWHAPAAILACAAGKHVYVEKPCSHNPREGELLVQAARRHNKRVQMGNQRRSWPAIIEAIDLVRNGAIGRVYFSQAWYTNNRGTIGRGQAQDPPKGFNYDLWQGPATRRPYRSNYHPYNWHWFWHYGNGELGNNGVHSLDLCRWGLGVDYPIRVTSSGGRYRFQDDQETPDTHVVSFEFEGRKMISWEGLSCNRLPAGRVDHVRFSGENGVMSITDTGYVITDPVGKETRRSPVQSGDAGHITNFLNAIRNGARLTSEIEDGHKSTLMCHLGNIAHRTGRALQCEARTGRIAGDKPAMNFWSREYHKGYEPQG